jgi:hypothetical protein
MTHRLRASALLCILTLAGPLCLVYAQVIPSHAVPEAFGALGLPSVVSVGPAENGSGSASETRSSRPWERASLPEHVLVSMRCWNDLRSASQPWQTISWQSSQGAAASEPGTRANGGTSEAFAPGVTCSFTTPVGR